LTRPLADVMRSLENYTLTWHHWLIILSLLKLDGRGTKAQVFPVFRKEGFSPHAIETVFKTDLAELGEVVQFEGDVDSIQDDTMLILTGDPRFRSFLRKHLKPIANTLKARKVP
jgi:hypothetical protein